MVILCSFLRAALCTPFRRSIEDVETAASKQSCKCQSPKVMTSRRGAILMTDKISQRDFPGVSALGFMAAASPGVIRSPMGANDSGDQSSNRDSEISIWVTSGDERFAAVPPPSWGAASGAAPGDHLQLNPSAKFQKILGFGGAFTDAACYTFNRLTPAEREKLFHELFHPSEMGLSVGRIGVGASDYSTKLYSYDEGEPDPDLARFSIEHDR